MVASQRFPRHFDGIVAGNPGFNLPKAAVAEAWDSQAFAVAATQLDVGGRQYLPTTFSFTDLTLVANAVGRVGGAREGAGRDSRRRKQRQPMARTNTSPLSVSEAGPLQRRRRYQ
jgi:hypothetical protein